MTYVFFTAPSMSPRRRTQLLIGLLLAALLAVLLAATGVAPASAGSSGGALDGAPGTVRKATAPLRVALVGDSMTQGQSGSTTYRYWLWREFGAQRVPVTFVGTYTRLARGGGASVYNRLDHGFETRHVGVAGSGFSFHLRGVADLVRHHRPDVVVLQLGFNDAGSHTPEQIAAATSRYLEEAWAQDPDLRFVLAEIVPREGAGAAWKNARTAAANDLVAAEHESEPRVAISRVRSHPSRPWDPAAHTFDGVHPNAVGETLMAQRHAEALAELGIFSRPVHVYHRAAWRPAVRPALPRGTDQSRLVLRDRRLVVNVRDTLRRTYAQRAEVLVTTSRGRTVRRTRWLARPRVSIRLRPGRYRVRLGVQRGTMRGLTRQAVVRVR